MRNFVTCAIGAVAMLALAAPVLAQQGGGQAPPPGAGAPPPGGAPGGGRPGGGGPGGPGGGGRPAPPPPNTAIPLAATIWGGTLTGKVTVLVDPPKGQMCYMLYGPDASASGAHIHAGTPAAPGATIATLKVPTNGSSGDCQTMPAATLTAMANNPGGYFVDVHTASDGLVAGALTK